jgi:hypothetical protein
MPGNTRNPQSEAPTGAIMNNVASKTLPWNKPTAFTLVTTNAKHLWNEIPIFPYRNNNQFLENKKKTIFLRWLVNIFIHHYIIQQPFEPRALCISVALLVYNNLFLPLSFTVPVSLRALCLKYLLCLCGIFLATSAPCPPHLPNIGGTII